MKTINEKYGLTIPGEFLDKAGLSAKGHILMTLSEGMILLLNTERDSREQQAVARGLCRAADDLSIPLELDTDGVFIPAEMLRDAGIDPWDEVELTMEEGRIIVERLPGLADELPDETWEELSDDAVLGRLPANFLRLLKGLHIHPAAVKDALLEGGYGS